MALAQPVEIIEAEDSVVACDGGNGPLGHPRVFLNMGDKDRVDCPYCGRRYVLKPGAKGSGGNH
ncbi:MAG TPA: zinc-finger domain-containing protein [Candidatus Cybelea sp.]|nr:zinc-finger domain-containing protein [Candidatus Cybelea sp.]